MFSPTGSIRNLFIAFALALTVLVLSFAGWGVSASRPDKPADKTSSANAKAAAPYIEYRLSVLGESGAPATPQAASPQPTEGRLTRAQSFNGDLRDLPQTKPRRKERPEREEPKVQLRTIGDGVTRDSGRRALGPNAPAPSPLTQFNGLDFLNFGAGRPPDTNGDVGPVYFIQSVNSSVGIYRKSDNVRVAAFSLDTLMSQGNFGNLCDTDNFGDPVVLYDSFEDRWVITDFAFQLDGSGNVINPPGNFQCFAASKTGDPVAGGWNFYSINTTGGLGDYGKFGIWPDGLYMTVNMFDYAASGSFQNVRVYAFNKAQMYANAPTPQVVSFDLAPSEFTVLPANARLQTGTPPAGMPNLYAVVWQFANVISTYKFHVDWNSISLSTFTGPFDSVAPTSFAIGPSTVPAMGGNANDTLSHRLMMQNQYTNISGVESLWNSHTVQGSSATQAAVRYYQVNVTGGTIAANTTQAATHNPDTANRYMPSLALNRIGDMMIGYSASSSTLKPAIRYAGRLAADPVNTLPQTETSLIEGAGAQNTSNRWGDYSTMTLDPDGCTFWFTSEYYAAVGGDWQTRIGSFKFPGCTNATSGTVQGTVTATVGGAPINGATVALGSRTMTTNASGFYSFTGIPAGTYPSITASAPGFNASTVASLVVNGGATKTQNFSLGSAPTSGCPADTTQADFQTGVATNADLTASPGNVILASVASLDQSNTAGTTTGTGFGTPNWTGQTFIPAITGTLVKVDVPLFCANGASPCTGPTGNLTLSVRNTSAGLPAGADLASATIPSFTSNAGATFTATFGAPPTLTSGTQYALILRPVSNPAAGSYFWIRSSPSTYANGSRVTSTDSGGTWATDTTRDFNFKTYMVTGYTASGNLISSTKDANPGVGGSAGWTTLSWTATTPANTSVQFQAAASNNVNGPFNFVGPNGTAGTFFTTSGASLSQFNGLRYLKYKAYLSTTNSAVTPTLNDVTVCFNNAANTPPTITAVAVARQAGSPVANSTIANVTDPDQALNTLAVTVNGGASATVNNVTVSGISVSAGGVVTANVLAACGATTANFTLTVTDAATATANATLTVTVTANSAPTLTYNNQSVAAGGALNINPATGPSDNGSVSTIVLLSQGTYTGTISVNNGSGVVSISNAKPGGVHTITIRATDNCGTMTDATFTLTVNCPTITLGPATLPNGTVGTGYNQTITASGGTAPYTFSVSAGTLPTSLTLAAGGALSGTPSVANTFNFTVLATDANGCTGTLAYAVRINAANTLPTISAVAVSRQQGSPVANSTIANVTDPDQALNTLSVTVNGGASATVNNVTVSGLSVSAAGVVTANVIAACAATAANFTLTVTDAASATANATLTVTVTANTAPLLAYTGPQNVLAGGALNVVPAIGPSDNGSISSLVVQSITPSGFTGTITVNSFGVVAVSNAGPANSYTVTIRATDNCGATTDASFRLMVNVQACTSSGLIQAAGSPYNVGDEPSSIAVADFNLDGKPDLAVANGATNNLTILLGNGSGSFTQAAGSPFSAGSNPFSVAVGDFNLDGKPDLAIANYNSANVTILLGNGSGGFTEPAGSPVSAGNSPASVAVGDFNLDGKPDLAVANTITFGTVTILLGNGNGGFTQAPGPPPSVGNGPYFVVAGDFNLDGKPDLATADTNSSSVTILVGNGSGGFTPSATSPAGTFPHSLAVTDFNLDGKPDLAVANRDSLNVTILLGNGSGGFTQPAGSPIAITLGSPYFVTAGDFNLDGKPDLAIRVAGLGGGSNRVEILSGNGNGSFGTANSTEASFGRALAIGDFDLDGKPDLATANSGPTIVDTVSVLLNACAPPMIAATPVSRTAGSPSANSQIAIVSDTQDALNTLAVTVNGSASATINGLTISGINVNAAGVVTANVVAACSATTANFTLRVTDSSSLFAEATLNVTVNPNTQPMLTYGNQAVAAGGALTINPATGPSDNGTVNSIVLQSQGTYTGTIGVNTGTGLVSISNAAPVGTHTITIRATDNCGAFTDAQFTLTVNAVNNPPTINAVAVSRQQGSPVANSIIANVTDPDQALNTLSVTVNSGASATVNGVTVSGISVSAAGVVTANVIAACPATTASFTLTVTDAASATANATLTVTVTANAPPTLTYNNQALFAGAGLNINPASGPSDNGSVSAIVVQSQGTYIGTISVNNSTGVVAISNAAPVGAHTLTIRATDNCGAVTDASFTLTVNNNLPQITAAAPLTRQQGSAGTVSTIATVSDTETAAGSLTVAATTVPAGLTVTGIVNTNGTITANVAALCNATLGANTVVLTVTDGNGGMATANLTVNVTANSAPVLTYANQAVAVGGSSNINPVTGPSDNGSVSTIAVQSQGTYTGTISVNNASGIVAISNAAPVGLHTITIRATDNCGMTTDATFTLTVGNNPPQITAGGTFARQQGSPAGAAVQIATVSDTETPAGSLTVTATTVPAGISVTSITNTSGTITATLAAGCTAALGNNIVTLTVTDGNSGTATANLTVNVTANTAPVLTYAAASVSAGGAASNSPTAASDNGNITGYAVQSQGTYTGTISVNASGVVSFSNAKPGGTHTITIRATDNCGATTDATFTLTVNCQTITVTNPVTTTGTAGTAFSQTFTQAGGLGTTTFSTASALPTGLTLSSGGVLSGTPTQAGTFPIVVVATDSNGCTGAGAIYALIIGCPTINVAPPNLPNGTIGAAYNQSVSATPAGTYSFSVTVGSLPTGLSLNGSTGAITGTPTASGTSNFTITATTFGTCTGTRTYALTIDCPAITVNPVPPLTAGTANTPFSQTFTQTGGLGTITWSNTGTLPPGLSLNAATGVLSGTPTTAGNFNFTIIATDGNNCTGSRAYTLTINCTAITVAPATLPNGTAGTAYSSQTISATPAGTTYSFSVTVGALPNGLTLNSATGLLSGTPTANGTFNFTVTATGFGTCTGTRAYNVIISCPTITVNPATTGPGTAGTAFSQAFTQSGGVGTINWTFTGTLPPGLSLNAGTGVLSGTPTTAGSFNFTIIATDANNCAGSNAYTLTINCPAVTVNPATLPNGSAGVAYNQTIAVTPAGTYSFSLTTGALPNGVTLNSSTGALSGTPTTTGTFNFRITATGFGSCTGFRDYSVTISCAAITVNPPTINPGTTGVGFNQGFSQSGGVGTITWSSTGTLPPGLTLNPASGVLSGTPTTGGTFNFTIIATDANACTGSRAYTLPINCAGVTVNPSNLAPATAGTAYSQTFTQTGGVGTITWSSTGTLPPGLTLNATTGVLSGLPSAAGVFNFTIIATDSNNCVGSRAYTLTLNCPAITLAPPTLPNGTAGAAYNQTLSASPAGTTYSFAVTAGALPPGVTLNSATGVLSGVPTTGGTFNFTVTATGFGTCTGSQAYVLTINCPTITLAPATLPNGNVGAPYNQTVSASPAGSYNFTVTAGAMPLGFALNAATGALTGTPTAAGTFNFTITATGFGACTGSQAYTLIITACPIITVNPSDPTLPNGRAGTAYSQTFTQTGGAGTVTFSVSVGTLPTGLTLANGGALTGTPTVNGTFNFTARATDQNNCTGERAYTLLINPLCTTITINPATLANGFVGTAYSQTLTATGGTAPHTFAVTAGAMPNGLALASGGALTGTPTTAGTFNFTVTATDNTGCTGLRAYSVVISGNGLQFYALPQPVRLLETRAGFSGCTTPGVPINANGTLTLPARTTCAGIPAAAAAITGNITVVPSGPGFLTLFPSSAAQPTVANSNFQTNEITNNVFTVGLGAGDGAFKIFSSATTHVIVDVTGYYAPPNTGGLYFHALATPVRLLETRPSLTGCITPGAPLVGTGNPNADPNLDLLLQGRSPVAAPCNSIPATAQVLVGNATSVLPTGLGYLTIYPSGGARPTVASSNYAGADVINGPFAVKLGADGKFKIYTFATTNLVVDILGYYSEDAVDANGAGLLFNPLPSPVRLLETRAGFAGCTMTGAPIVGNLNAATHTQMAANFCTLPANAQAVVGNVSVVNTTGAGFLTLFPANLTTAPLVATSNYPAPATFGYNRHFFVGLSPVDGKFKVLTQFTTDLILDASGYFAP